MQPTAPAALKDEPLRQESHVALPPIEKDPASQRTVSVLARLGFDPAAADEQANALADELYCPSTLHSVQASTPPAEALPAGHSSAAVFAGFVLYPALTVAQYAAPEAEIAPKGHTIQPETPLAPSAAKRPDMQS